MTSGRAAGTLPRLAITIGESSGVGPELALRAVAQRSVIEIGVPLIFGDASVLHRVGQALDLPVPGVTESLEVDRPAIFDCGSLDSDHVQPGRFSRATGQASFETVCAAIDAALAGSVDAIVTGPIQKEAWHEAGIRYPGHTELLADRASMSPDGVPADVRMMLTSPAISCVLETIHVPIADVPGRLRIDSLVRTIDLAAEAIEGRLRARGRLLPARVAVLGLNPHAGENGLFSHGEEEAIIVPAIERAIAAGRDVIGPLPPDTAFTPATRDRVDVHVCMYHDQGLIPLKALAFDDAVNVTLGLPIVRTSVDHGTAMDLAWQGKASHNSLIAAIEMAAAMVKQS